jgi:hypothetical protein
MQLSDEQELLTGAQGIPPTDGPDDYARVRR